MNEPNANKLPPSEENYAAKQKKKPRKTAAITAGIIVLLYGAFFRWVFGTPWLEAAGGVVSTSFILSVPLACGFLCVAIGRLFGSDNWSIYALLVPVIAICYGLIISLVTKIEAMICVIMAAPILLGAIVLGGFIGHCILPRNKNHPRLYVSFAMFLPFAAAWFESSLGWPTEMRSITNTIIINAPAENIWPEIASVRAIDPTEIRDSWIYGIGFPRPLAATLDRHEVGGIRTATFERNISFFEEVTEWKKNERLAFSIRADPAFVPSDAFDQHIIVGGRFYDVLDGVYEIEPINQNQCRLHLTSHHRLSTHFNAYAGWWSVQIMNEIQGTILEVIRKRAEGSSLQILRE
jgi:hypothetical protein